MNKNKYDNIIKKINDYFGESNEDMFFILEDKYVMQLFLLLLKYNNCLDVMRIKKIMNKNMGRGIFYYIDKAEEKLMVNREFRNDYLELESNINKNK